MNEQNEVKPISDLSNKTENRDYENRVKESLTFAEIGRVIAVCDLIFEKALIETAVNTAIRREDLAKIEMINVDLEKRRIRFYEEKKDRWWVVALEPELIQTLKMYIATLPKGQRYLFDISGRTMYNIFQKLLKKAGINKALAFHSLRRTFIRLSKQMGRDIRFVMDQTGDTAETIINEYEGYPVDELVQMMEKDGILKRTVV